MEGDEGKKTPAQATEMDIKASFAMVRRDIVKTWMLMAVMVIMQLALMMMLIGWR